MTVKEVIDLTRMLKQIDEVNYPDELLVHFLNECEGKIQTEFLHICEQDCQKYSADDMGKDMIVRPPHDKLYYTYLCAMVDFTNGEYAKYNNSITIANSFMSEWAAWFNRTHHRHHGHYEGVFLSAYAIALKWGYEGTEEEWLASLVGPRGEQGIPGPKGDPGSVEWDNITPEQIEMLRGPQGIQGVQGVPGRDGRDGRDGVDGLPGRDGVDGLPGRDGVDGQRGEPGQTGDTGATFTPSIDANGVISWTNDKGKQNPAPVSVRGPKGDKGDTYAPDIIEAQEHQPASETNRVWIATGETEIEIPTMEDLNREKEWVLKGTITTAEKDTGVNVDLSGCTELVITGYTKATAATNIRGITGGESYTLGNSVAASGERSFFIQYEDTHFGISGNGKYATAADSKYYGNLLTCYIISGVFVADFTKVYFLAPAGITECNVKIYAR